MVLRFMKRVLVGPDKEIKILQWNCNGVRKKRTVLKDFMYKEKIDIAFLQESHLNPHHKFDLGPDYVIHRKDRHTHKGGVISVFHKKFTRVYRMNISIPAGIEGQSWILIYSGLNKNLILHNWYCTPRHSNRKKGFTLEPLLPYMKTKSILVGDFNSKSHWWGYDHTDSLGRSVQSLVNSDQAAFLNIKGISTLRSGTTPDLSIATRDIVDRCTWRTGPYLASDHKTILVTYSPHHSKSNNNNRVIPCQKPKKKKMNPLSRLISRIHKYFLKRWMRVFKRKLK
eukprot:TRINITY_DN9640_c0_g1_i1.p1 TRINITY_DN9640_c0_g1~~TRINITY_DN9640_c0_g1_i1.p1  ORF type:complete len:283 (+),score=46.28 TRINITY_DN9640_c0_g1_i1:36-884(+)